MTVICQEGFPAVRWQQCSTIPDESCLVLREIGDGAPDLWLLPNLRKTDLVIATPMLLQVRYKGCRAICTTPYRLHTVDPGRYSRVIYDAQLFRREAKVFRKLCNACQEKPVIFFNSDGRIGGRIEELCILLNAPVLCPRCKGSGDDPEPQMTCCGMESIHGCCGDPVPGIGACGECEGTGAIDQ